MPKNSRLKQRARAYAETHGVSYIEALRVLTQDQPVASEPALVPTNPPLPEHLDPVLDDGAVYEWVYDLHHARLQVAVSDGIKSWWTLSQRLGFSEPRTPSDPPLLWNHDESCGYDYETPGGQAAWDVAAGLGEEEFRSARDALLASVTRKHRRPDQTNQTNQTDQTVRLNEVWAECGWGHRMSATPVPGVEVTIWEHLTSGMWCARATGDLEPLGRIGTDGGGVQGRASRHPLPDDRVIVEQTLFGWGPNDMLAYAHPDTNEEWSDAHVALAAVHAKHGGLPPQLLAVLDEIIAMLPTWTWKNKFGRGDRDWPDKVLEAAFPKLDGQGSDGSLTDRREPSHLPPPSPYSRRESPRRTGTR